MLTACNSHFMRQESEITWTETVLTEMDYIL